MDVVKKEKLTGLLYFDFFKEDAQRNIDEGSKKLVLFSVNINDFTYINHKYGYIEGDKVLVTVAEWLAKSNNVIVASRAYSDHFFVLADMEDRTIAQLASDEEAKCVEFVRKMRQEYPLAAFDISMGIYIVEPGENISSAVDKVELARKSENKRDNKRVVPYREEMTTEDLNRKSVVPMFKNAIDENRIIAFYQPKMASTGQKLVGAEALARIIDPDGNILSPYQFVAQLEETSLICELDLYILEQVHKDMMEWKSKGLDLIPVSVNLSRVDFYDDMFLDKIRDIVGRYSIDPYYIIFEVTETMFFDDLDYMIEQVNKIKELGYRVSLDDFGSGYSSLSMVSKIPVDEIKFDRSFVQNSLDSDKGIKIISGLIHTIKDVDMEIIGEGIESSDEEQIMKDAGCDVIQGYLYDMPLKMETFANKYLC